MTPQQQMQMRQRLNPQLGGGRFMPTMQMQPPQDDPSVPASQQAGQRELAWNRAAAIQNAQMRQGAVDNSTTQDNTQGITTYQRAALAKALGNDPTNPPPIGQLLARFYSQPPEVQAGIYKAGGAPFIDPESGMKLIEAGTKNRNDAINTRINQIGEDLTKGDIKFDPPASQGAAPSFYRYVDDPTLPPGTRKIKQPLSPGEMTLMGMGVSRGAFPNPVTGAMASEPGLPNAQPKMSEDDFQQVLNNRANPVPTSSLTPILNLPSNSSGDSNSTMSLTPYQYGSNMSLTPYAYGSNMPLTPTAAPSPSVATPALPDSAITARNAVGNFVNRNLPTAEDANNAQLGNLVNLPLQGVVNGYNAGISGINWLGRFAGGVGSPQIPRIPSVIDDSTLGPNDAAMIANRLKQPQQDDDDSLNMSTALMGP